MRHSLHVLALLPCVLLLACGGTVPPPSLVAGRLRPCPPTPNCVSTDSTEPDDRRMPSIPFADTPSSVRLRILAALRQEPRTVVVQERGEYLRAAATSRVFRFVDDVELLIDTAAHQILFRSSARLGHGDLGVNRARMERMKARLRM